MILNSENEKVEVKSIEKVKIDKARSFAFMSELLKLYYLKIETMSATAGKATPEDFPKEKVKADKPLLQVNMILFHHQSLLVKDTSMLW